MGKTVKYTNELYDESGTTGRWTSHQKAMRRARIQQLAGASLEDIGDTEDSGTDMSQHYLWNTKTARRTRHR